MGKNSLKEQVEIIRQAFGYIERFKGETFVIRISSELIASPFIPVLLKDLVLLHRMGIRIILVPGARSRIDEVLATYGVACRRLGGIRISPPESIPFIQMAAFDVSNRIMTVLAEFGANAVIGNWVRARSIGVRDGVDYQSAGIVDKLQTDVLVKVLDEGMIPIFPNIGWSARGTPYNLSSNELAATISVLLKASKLFFLTNRRTLSADADSYTWVAAAIGSQNAAGLQLGTELPVMAIGGFNGSDPSPTLAEFQQYVEDGRIHYFVAGGGMGGGGMGGSGSSSEISTWVQDKLA